MTIPLYAPFFLLATVCAIYPRPKWVGRVDWFRLGCWAWMLGWCAVFWFSFCLFAVWVVS